MGKKLLKFLGVGLIVSSILVVTIPSVQTDAVVLDAFQLDHDSLDKYEGTATTVSVPSEIRAIGEEAFANNQYIAQVDTGMNTESIEHGAFANCPYLYSVTTHDKLEKIDTAAFAGDNKLVSINLGASLTNMGYGVFAGCNNLTSINISRNNPYFTVVGAGLYNSDGDMLYAYMGGVKATYYKMPNSVERISKYCFWGNDKLDSVSISSYVHDIPAYAFSNCKNLKSVNIPYSVTTIDAKAFENCVSLADVSIPASVSYIDPTAFDGCVNLNIIADPGTAAYNFFQNFDRSDVAKAENGDVKVVLLGDSTNNGNASLDNSEESADYYESTGVFGTGLVDASTDPSNVDYMPKIDPLSNINGSDIIAKTVVVGGQAVLFLNPNQNVKEGVLVNTSIDSDSSFNNTDTENQPVIYDSSKGGYLPKFTEINNKIASQAYYANRSMEDYSIPSNINDIGDFAFARSNLESVIIPDGVTHIGYGAFYHCDNLKDVKIPSSVSSIEGYAFANTGFINNFNSDVSAGDFLIVGNGILLAYKGNNSVVTIPDGVKTIAPAVFMNHNEITGVSFPTGLTEIGEDAFRDCTSLSSLSGSANIEKIADRAFMNCPLSTVIIPDSVKEIGLRAFDYSNTSKPDNTKVIVFEGTDLPGISYGKTSLRLENSNYRQNALYNVLFAVVDNDVNVYSDSVLENNGVGFSGIIVTRELDDSGNETGYVTVKENYIYSIDVLNNIPDSIAISGKNYQIKDRDSLKLSATPVESIDTGAEVSTYFNNSKIPDVKGVFSENESVGTLRIDSSDSARDSISELYSELFGKDNTPVFAGYNITLTDKNDVVPINKFGHSSLSITMPIPSEVNGETYHVVTIDSDGQLEEVNAVVDEMVKNITFTTNHLSKFGIYATDGDSGRSILKNGKTVKNYKKDASPDTGDRSIPVNVIVAFLLLCLGVFCLIYKKKII